MTNPPILVCFAVREEAKHFSPRPVPVPRKFLITGMGAKNAEKNFRKEIESVKPRLVITAGFAGGLNPQLTVGNVVFDEDAEAGLSAKLLKLGCVKAKFHCASRVAVTAAEKWQLWQSTGADAVEMESEIIRNICKEHNIPSATVRVISDGAGEDLPLDFNALMTKDEQMNYFKLIRTVIFNPRKIPQLMRFQQQTITAARKLGEALNESLADIR